MLYLVPYLIASAYAAVYVGFPFSEQLPNVARIDEPYSFTLANISYRSTSDAAIVYSASNLPSWLSFDGGSRTFTGLPSTSDLGEFEITLLGEDPGDGSKASINYSMIVSNSSGLHLTSPDAMFAQIAQYGRTNGNSGLVVKQGDQFDIKLDSKIFESYDNASRPIIAYYGRSQDRSSLPNWIKFNSDKLSFSGTVPYVTSSIAPSFEYGFSFIASDYYGFAGAEAIFKLIVGAHELSTSQNRTIHVNGTLKSEIDETIPIFSQVYLDGTLIDRSNISRVYSDDLPKYVLLNTDNYTLTGTFPDSNTFDNFSIYVQDVFQNTVVLPYSVSALGSVFTVNSLPLVNATRGEYFEYQLLDSLFTDGNNTTVDVSYSGDWLSFNTNNKTLSGITPKNFDSLDVLVAAKSSFDDESKSFSIKGIEGSANPTSSSSSAKPSATSSSTSSSASSSASASATALPTSKSNLNKKSLAIGLGVGVPAFILLLAAIFLLCCCAKRRRRRTEEAAAMDNEKGAVAPTSPELNGPGFGQTFDKDDHDENAKQLAALNVLKLDKKGNALDNYDARSTSSSITHVDYNSDNSDYYDASEKPVKSWRANDKSDMADMAVNNSKGTKKFRESEISLSTVNTEQLFSVRLVDDQLYRNSNQSSSFNSRQFLSNGSLNALLRSSSSGNIQRLDSDGNIVETLPSNFNNTPGISRPPSTNLNVLTEENARDISTVKEDNSTIYHSPHHPGDETDASSFNLLAKFDNSRNPSQSNLERDLSNYQLHHDNFPDEFKATQVSNGEFKWLENNSKPNITTSTSIDHNSNNPFKSYNNDLVSPSSDYFLHRGPGEEQSPATLQNTPMKNSNLSALSIGSNNSENLLLENNRSIDNVNHPNTARTVAKLVDFTRKGSLRESAYKPDYSYHDGETAQIHDDNDSD